MPRSKHNAPCIVLPTDFQRPARRAFTYGLAMARLFNARLRLLHVIKLPSGGESLPPDTRYARMMRTSALLELGRLARLAREAGVEAEPIVDFGVPDDCILRHLRQERATLLVMGTEGRTGWDRLRLGSTAQTLVRRADCPVLAVHGGVAGDVARQAARVKLNRIVVGTDFSSCARQAQRVAERLAQLANAMVVVVHVQSIEDDGQQGWKRLDRTVQTLQRRGVRAEGLCRSGNPVETLVEEAGRWEADLVVVGTQGRRGLSRLMLGSVAEGVLRRAGCPVLVVRSAETLLNK
ncbi:MAG: universal stress protein [Nitrospira sp.]|nr:universal stress protein [Nitrospira sp.]